MNKSDKTKYAIAHTLIEELKKKPLDLITIKELTQKAHVGRTAFYNHFHNLDDVLKFIYRDAHKKTFQDKYKDQYYQLSDEYLKDMIDFFDCNFELLHVLFKWNLIDMIAKYNTEIVLNYVKDYDDEIIKKHPFYFTCYAGVTTFNMCASWILGGKKESKEEFFNIIKYFQNMYHLYK